MPKFFPVEIPKKITEEEYYRKIGFTKISDNTWAGPRQPMKLKLGKMIT